MTSATSDSQNNNSAERSRNEHLLDQSFLWVTRLLAIVVAIARAAGETSPLIFTSLFTQFWPSGLSQPTPTLSVLIYNFASVPYENQRELAWAASLILVLLILIANIIARLIARRSVY